MGNLNEPVYCSDLFCENDECTITECAMVIMKHLIVNMGERYLYNLGDTVEIMTMYSQH